MTLHLTLYPLGIQFCLYHATLLCHLARSVTATQFSFRKECIWISWCSSCLFSENKFFHISKRSRLSTFSFFPFHLIMGMMSPHVTIKSSYLTFSYCNGPIASISLFFWPERHGKVFLSEHDLLSSLFCHQTSDDNCCHQRRELFTW